MSKGYFIYTHTSPSGKVYVGQTTNVKRRWGYNGEHYRNKKDDGSYIQPLFARAIVKYGWNSFEHKIILECSSKNEADYAEKYLIKWYKLHNMSYNCTDGGEGTPGIHRRPLTLEERVKISNRVKKNPPMKGKKHTPEAMAKIIAANRNRVYTPEQKAIQAQKRRAIMLGRKLSSETIKKISDYRKSHPETWIGGWNKQEVHQYNVDGKYIASYPSAMHAAKALDKNIGSDIGRCIKGKAASAGGYIWKEEKVSFLDMSKYKVVKTAKGARFFDISEEGRQKRSAAHGKAINQYTIEGKYVTTYCTASEAARQTGINYSGITRCCNHEYRHKTAGGYRWEYDNIINRVDSVA